MDTAPHSIRLLQIDALSAETRGATAGRTSPG
jgi:hypothetical protein